MGGELHPVPRLVVWCVPTPRLIDRGERPTHPRFRRQGQRP
jgi:hypothetical protein